MKSSLKSKIIILFILLGAAIVLSLSKGAANIALCDLLTKENRIIFDMRLLRIIIAILAGSGLAVSGIALQAILRNSLAEPYLLGTSSGAGLAAIIGMILGLSRVYMPLAAFCGAILSIIIVYNLALENGKVSDKSLILSGVIVSIGLSAIIVFLASLFCDKTLHELTWWLWGSLQTYDPQLIAVISIPVLTGIGIIYIFSQDLNALTLGEEEAVHLGIDTVRLKKILITITAIITASLICICGIIGFVGLIIPHMMRLIVGPNHKTLIPMTCLAASVFMIVCDLISRTVFAPLEIPIGVITAIIGAPIFILLMKKRRGFK